MAELKGGVEIIGMQDVLSMLHGVPIKVGKVTRKATATITRQARDEVKAAAPVVTGDLKRSIAVKGAKPKNDRFSYAVIARQNGGKTGQGYHYHLVEYGTVKMTARRFAAPIRAKYTGESGSARFRAALATAFENEILKKLRDK